MKKSRLALNSAAVLGASLCWLPNLSAQTVIFPGETLPTNQPNGSGGQWGNGYNTITSVVITTGYENIQSAANLQSPAVANAVTAPAIFIQINVDPTTNGAPTDITSSSEWYADYDVAMDTSSGGTSQVTSPAGVENPYGNPFGISTGMNYYINGFNIKGTAPSTVGDNKEYHYTGNGTTVGTGAWTQTAGNGTSYNATTTVITPTSITYGIPLSDLGLSAGNSFTFDAYSDFGGLPYGALDNSTFAPTGYYPYSGGPSPEAVSYDSATEPGSTLSTYNVGAPTLTWNNTAPAGTQTDGVTWVNATNATASTSLLYNWNNGLYADYYVDGSNVIFNDVNNATSNGGTNASAYSVTLNSTVNPGSVIFNNSLGNYTLSGTGSIAGTASLTKTGTSTATISTPNTYSGGTFVNGGTLVIAPTSVANTVALPDGAVSIGAAGTLQLAINAVASSPFVSSQADISNQLLKMTSLSITSGGILDVGNNHFNVADPGGLPNDSTFSTILGYVKNGEITSSDVNNAYGIGVVDGNDSIPGTPVSAGQIEVAYTLNGDANLDGKVDATDFGIFAPNFGATGFTLGWEGGDFNYDGKVDATDFGLFAPNFGQSDSGTAISLPAADYAALDAFAAANGLSLTSVPEPASASLILLTGTGLLIRRRRTS